MYIDIYVEKRAEPSKLLSLPFAEFIFGWAMKKEQQVLSVRTD